LAVTLPSVRARVQVKIRQSDSRKFSIGPIEVDQAIRDAYLLMASRLPAAHVVATSALTIASGADTFSLAVASSEEYEGDVRIQKQTDRRFLDRLTVEEIDAYRSGQTSSYTGIPERFALWEDTATVVQGRVHPRANAAYVCDIYRSVVAADFDLTAVDATSIAFSRYGINALIIQAASDLVASMTDEMLKERGLSGGIAGVWAKQAEVALYREQSRRNSLASTGRTHRMVV